MNTFHIAPHEQEVDAQDPTTSEFGQDWMAGSVAYILFKEGRTRPTRVVVSAGEVRDAEVGQYVEVRDDQTSRLLGTYGVAGIVHYDDGGNVAFDEGPYGDFNRTLRTASMK